MNNKGMTLVELMVVTSVIGILIIALGFTYIGWVGRYKVESTVKNLYSDLIDARGRAMQRNRVHFIDIPNANSYRMSEDDSDGTAKVSNGDGILQIQAVPGVSTPNTDTTVLTFPKTIEYPLSVDIGIPVTFTFNKRGMASPAGIICINTLSTDVDADYDCIDVAQTRIKTGKLTKSIANGGACSAANCVAK